MAFWLRKADIPYYVHIVGDPEDVAKAKTWHWPRFLSCAVSQHYKKRFQKLVRCSRGALSVTELYLKNKYPSGISKNDQGVSDVRLPEEIFKERSRDFEQRPIRLIIVGALLQYKGHDILLKALSKINSQCVWRLDIVGDGSCRPALEKCAKNLGISEKVDFCGRLKWGKNLFDKLEQADLFILSSLTEGMPRVVLEAMAKSLPVIAADVGGISEVLPSDVLFKAGDVDGLAKVISKTWNHPARLKELSQMNYKRVQDFRQVHLSRIRRQWLQRMRNGWQPDSEC
ncbi:MAG TPA: glycosyltransferase [Anaerohalosphaeraceae bacterium]|nr:glycosyltransferase [Anaerohalosphaeraceae bacterium]